MKSRYLVNLVVEVSVVAEGPNVAAAEAELTIQRLLDERAKRLRAVVGADYADVTEEVEEECDDRQ